MIMKLKYEILGRKVIKQAAKQQGLSPETYRREIKTVIDEAWAHPTTEQLLLQKQLFPLGKPSPEEFLIIMAIEVHKDGNPPNNLCCK